MPANKSTRGKKRARNSTPTDILGAAQHCRVRNSPQAGGMTPQPPSPSMAGLPATPLVDRRVKQPKLNDWARQQLEDAARRKNTQRSEGLPTKTTEDGLAPRLNVGQSRHAPAVATRPHDRHDWPQSRGVGSQQALTNMQLIYMPGCQVEGLVQGQRNSMHGIHMMNDSANLAPGQMQPSTPAMMPMQQQTHPAPQKQQIRAQPKLFPSSNGSPAQMPMYGRTPSLFFRPTTPTPALPVPLLTPDQHAVTAFDAAFAALGVPSAPSQAVVGKPTSNEEFVEWFYILTNGAAMITPGLIDTENAGFEASAVAAAAAPAFLTSAPAAKDNGMWEFVNLGLAADNATQPQMEESAAAADQAVVEGFGGDFGADAGIDTGDAALDQVVVPVNAAVAGEQGNTVGAVRSDEGTEVAAEEVSREAAAASAPDSLSCDDDSPFGDFRCCVRLHDPICGRW